MPRPPATLPQTARWDLVVTASGVNILVVPREVVADLVIVADDGVVLQGDRPLHLLSSARVVPHLRRRSSLILVATGGGGTRETAVPVVAHLGSVHARSVHDHTAAA